jgi:DNA-binding MarR family transcriptional regulator/predicted GNAT family N-acyltransferase
LEFDQNMVADIRQFNRFYTDVLGLIDQDILDSGYSLTEARILYELSAQGAATANQIAAQLRLDKSYMSRIVAGFVHDGLVARRTSEQDNRALVLALTEKGRKVAAELSARSNLQVKTLLAPLKEQERQELAASMHQIQVLLKQSARRFRLRAYEGTPREGEYILQKQLEIYEREYGFTSDAWKTYVAEGVSGMMKGYSPEKEHIWLLEVDGNLSGCIAIVQPAEQTAQLRFFFVDPALRGLGAGELLIDSALMFCREKRYRSVFLWTCGELKAARHLYGKHGFVLTESHENSEWGIPITEERWELALE